MSHTPAPYTRWNGVARDARTGETIRLDPHTAQWISNAEWIRRYGEDCSF